MPGPRLVPVLLALAFVFLFTMMAGLALSILPHVDGARSYLLVTAWAAAAVYVAGLAASVVGLWRAIGGARRRHAQAVETVEQSITRGARIGE